MEYLHDNKTVTPIQSAFPFPAGRKWLMFWQQATFFDQPFSTKGHSSYHHYHPLCIGSCFTGGYMSVPACICLYLLLPPLYMCNHDNLQYMLMMLLPRPSCTNTCTMVQKTKFCPKKMYKAVFGRLTYMWVFSVKWSTKASMSNGLKATLERFFFIFPPVLQSRHSSLK